MAQRLPIHTVSFENEQDKTFSKGMVEMRNMDIGKRASEGTYVLGFIGSFAAMASALLLVMTIGMVTRGF